MATLVLGTVGRAIGGPIGGLVGSLLGGGVDRAIFGTTTRDGPRLANLAVQSAAYGEPLPRIYGRMRVAGNLVWTAGIKESRQRSGGGKGRTATNTYSYSASFAVVVAAREIDRVERVWADGKLLRASDGVFNYPATMRVHRGSEGQAVDPLIAAAEGVDQAPAYRGSAYVVFEDLPLADYGNRIPNLTFEVVADASEGITIGAIATDISGGLVSGQVPATVTGFAAAQAGTARQALAGLNDIADLTLRDDGAALSVGPPATPSAAVADDDLGAVDHAAPGAARREARGQDGVVPDAIWLSYSDPARDYQAGIQAATYRTPAVRIDHRDLPIAASAGLARDLAETQLRRTVARRTTSTLSLPWRYAGLRPGDTVIVGTSGFDWRITHRTIAGSVIDLEVERVAAPATAIALPADGGRAYRSHDAPQGLTTLHVLDLPPLPGPLPTVPALLLAASGVQPGWRRVDIVVSRDGGESYALAATLSGSATVGTTLGALTATTSSTWDRTSLLEVELLDATMDLFPATEAAVLAGANLAVVGDELIQFAGVERLGSRRFGLSNLLRGRRGSEADMATHRAGERFVLVDDRLASVDLPLEVLGTELRFKAVGPAEDPAAVSGQAMVPRGVALRPLSPAALTSARTDAGDRLVTWQRRSRAGFGWNDGADVPVAEDGESYRILVMRDETVVRAVETVSSAWVYAAADEASDRGPGGALSLSVAQLSAVVGAGRVTSLILSPRNS